MPQETFTVTLKELSPKSKPRQIKINLSCEAGQLWIRPQGYGDCGSADGHGHPVGLEIWQGRLRLIVFDDINREDPRIIDLENARESHRAPSS